MTTLAQALEEARKMDLTHEWIADHRENGWRCRLCQDMETAVMKLLPEACPAKLARALLTA